MDTTTAEGSMQITPENIEQYLEQHQQKELLRFVAVGSVDDGKSTLIGRLLHDTKGVYEDQLSAVKKASQHSADQPEEIDFSLFTDGLRAEREQGITIDVAYRYFSTEKRKFIIADTPGHVQYTRNMATGASTANVAIILIDARLGVLPQSRRHATIASLLGIPHLAVAINKMDLRDYDESVFHSIREDFLTFADQLGFKDVKFIPISAKNGDNVVHSSQRTPWYDGGTLLEYLEAVPVAFDRNIKDFRFPVQNVIRPNLDYRGFAGEVAAGFVRQGDSIVVLPSRKTSTVLSIDVFDGQKELAGASEAVVLRLQDEIDISRGDMIAHPDNLPHVGRRFDARLVWMSEKPLDLGKSYLLKHTTQMVRANFEEVTSVTNLESFHEEPAESLSLNDIGTVRIACHRPIFFDEYKKSRSTGAFVIIDSITNNTVAAGMIQKPASSRSLRPGQTDAMETGSQVSEAERRERLGQAGACIVLHGKDASELAFQTERILFDRGRVGAVMDTSDAVSGALGAEDASLAHAVARLVSIGVVVVLTAPLSESVSERLRSLVGAQAWLVVTQEAERWVVDEQSVDTEGAREAVSGRIVDCLEERGLLDDLSEFSGQGN